jgi:hypothetical protein
VCEKSRRKEVKKKDRKNLSVKVVENIKNIEYKESVLLLHDAAFFNIVFFSFFVSLFTLHSFF